MCLKQPNKEEHERKNSSLSFPLSSAGRQTHPVLLSAKNCAMILWLLQFYRIHSPIGENTEKFNCNTTRISHSQILFYIRAEEEEVPTTEELPSSPRTENSPKSLANLKHNNLNFFFWGTSS